ncbi:MAG: hypothetical protein J6D42_02975 [Clostridia bacterium]|nr:hypothetical protein [Clostridia bacterium]
METKEFNALLRVKNKKYLELFGYIPCITDYSCDREQYLRALDEAFKKHIELNQILPLYHNTESNVEN